MEAERDLARVLCEEHPEEAARLLERLGPDDAVAVLEDLPPGAAGSALTRVGPGTAAACLGRLSPERCAPIVSGLALDDATRLLRLLEAAARQRFLESLPAKAREAVTALLRHPEGTAGALMDPRALVIPTDWTVAETIAKLREDPGYLRHYLYVVEREGGGLAGVLSLRMLLLAEPGERISSVMIRDVERFSVQASAMALLGHPGWRRFRVMPVVDERGAFAGVVRHDAVLRLAVDVTPGGGPGAFATALNLGELCWIGFAGVLAGIATSMGAQGPRPGR